MTYLDTKVDFRLRAIEYEQMRRIVEKNQDLFENISHFVRCAVIKHLREFKGLGIKAEKFLDCTHNRVRVVYDSGDIGNFMISYFDK